MKVLFAGDMSFNYFDSLPKKDKMHADVSEAAAEFKKADFSVLNLENILGSENDYTPIIKSGPNLISDDGFMEYINALNPTVVGLANNHSMDYGKGAMYHTRELLKNNGFQVIGAGENASEAYKSAVLEKDGIKCAVIAVCENEFGTTDGDCAGTAGLSLARVTEAVSGAIADGAMPVIYFHGGNEYNPFPSPKKTELYRHFVDIGAKAVIAMHTHCPQGYELYKGCPIVYSMGNFFFPKSNVAYKSWYKGYMTVLDFEKDTVSMEIVPYKFSFGGHELLKAEEKQEFIGYIDYISGEIADRKKIREYFDAWCMITGTHYLSGNCFYEDKTETYTPEDVKHFKNLWGCEAHNEMVSNTLKIVYEGRAAEAKKCVEKIQRLQNLQI